MQPSHDEILEHFEREHHAGDRLACIDCVLYCRQHGLKRPDWALGSIEGALDRWRRNHYIDLEDAFFPGRGKGGRTADPRTKQLGQRWREAVRAANRGAEMAGYKGPKRSDMACAILAEVQPGKPFEIETLDKINRRQRKLEQRDSSRLQARLTVAGGIDALVDSTTNAVMASGILHRVLKHK